MPGVSWDDRESTDWLASNGRWYEQSKHPRGWSTSALPPAPGHGGVGEILRRFVGTASPDITMTTASTPPSASTFSVDGDDSEFSAGWSVASDGPRPPSASASSAPGTSVVRTGRHVASATVTEPAPPSPVPAQELPAPPGRLGALPKAAPPMPAPPKKLNAPKPPPPAPARQTASVDVVAGDLGKVLGSAKRRIERAINESAESATPKPNS